MKNITRLIVIEAIIFIVAGTIALLLRNITYDSHATVFINCGFVTLAIGVLIEIGSKRGAM